VCVCVCVYICVCVCVCLCVCVRVCVAFELSRAHTRDTSKCSTHKRNNERNNERNNKRNNDRNNALVCNTSKNRTQSKCNETMPSCATQASAAHTSKCSTHKLVQRTHEKQCSYVQHTHTEMHLRCNASPCAVRVHKHKTHKFDESTAE